MGREDPGGECSSARRGTGGGSGRREFPVEIVNVCGGGSR